MKNISIGDHIFLVYKILNRILELNQYPIINYLVETETT